MENELKEVFAKIIEEVPTITSDKTLNDYGNEQVITLRYDIEESEDGAFDYIDIVNEFKAFEVQLKEAFAERFTGDHVVILEAHFATNNHYFYVVGAYK